jgi:phage gp46-like protein
MTDLKTTFIDMNHRADLALDAFELATDDGLDTAVLLSLFTDARARDDDTLAPGQTDRRGWWGDAYAEATDNFGSRLWLLHAAKQLQESLTKAREYAEEALAWLVEDGIAGRIEVETWIVRDELMGMLVRIHRPDGTTSAQRYDVLWSAL